MERISRYLSYLLRHDPEDLPMRKDGFVPIEDVLRKLKRRFPSVDRAIIEKLAEGGESRFEIKDNMIRALYGHTIPVEIHLKPADDVKYL